MKSYQNKDYGKPYVLKPTIIDSSMILLQDTREQRPLFTRIPKGLTIQSATLHDGDYSIKGFENRFAIERKFIGDLFSYCSSEREKTVAKMQRFRVMIENGGWVGLCIEEKESTVYQHQNFTQVSPETVRGALISFSVRYRVQVYFAGNRENAARWILDHACRFYKVVHEV